MTKYITVKLTEDQALFTRNIIEEYLRVHTVTNNELGILNRLYKSLAKAKNLEQ